MAKFLDLNGLSHFWGLVKEKLDTKVDKSLTINKKDLRANITLTAADVNAIPTSSKGVASGVAELDSTGKVPTSQLPSYVDDVVEGYLNLGKFYKEPTHATPITGEPGKIYINLTENGRTYRWSGTTFAEIPAGVALGTTSSSAYYGDKGKIAYDHSQSAHAPANAEANVQSDWNVQDAGSDAYIKNKPASLPANGGNADTVNGHTVGIDVPRDAKFTDTVYTHPSTSGNKHIPSGGSTGQVLRWSADGTAVWGADKDTTYSPMKGASLSAAGVAGLVPAPATGDQAKFLRGDGTWVVPTDTTYASITNQEIDGIFV